MLFSKGNKKKELPKEFNDVLSIGSAENTTGTILGQLDNSGKKVISLIGSNKDIAVFAPPGSGTIYSFSKPFCIQAMKRGESVIIADPDGGLYRELAPEFKKNNYVVKCLNLNNPKAFNSWNCLGCISTENIETDVQNISESILPTTKDDEYLSIVNQMLLKALILRVTLGDDFPQETKNLKSVFTILNQLYYFDDGISNKTIAALEEVFDPAGRYRTDNDAVQVVNMYKKFKELANASCMSNAIETLFSMFQTLNNNDILTMLSTDDIDITLPAKQPCAYFFVFPDVNANLGFINNLFINMLYSKQSEFADKQKTGCCAIPVNFLFNDFFTLGYVPCIRENVLALRRKHINTIVCCKDITELHNLGEGILSHAFDAKLFFNTENEKECIIHIDYHNPIRAIKFSKI